ncbi:hypothetical protein BDQ12DRAFT_737835 [Crucibulum laeve]|uniref:Uncharacterized protein n=1 Tax=Crucibulum laeve TaxID=68775 RepID=A0A5C3M1R4_9AGAR|nr:hypothetical protein BDQ12DRAFT_737835 [Crucibulum laeve]
MHVRNPDTSTTLLEALSSQTHSSISNMVTSSPRSQQIVPTPLHYRTRNLEFLNPRDVGAGISVVFNTAKSFIYEHRSPTLKATTQSTPTQLQQPWNSEMSAAKLTEKRKSESSHTTSSIHVTTISAYTSTHPTATFGSATPTTILVTSALSDIHAPQGLAFDDAKNFRQPLQSPIWRSNSF